MRTGTAAELRLEEDVGYLDPVTEPVIILRVVTRDRDDPIGSPQWPEPPRRRALTHCAVR